MAQKNETISVIVPCYNGERFIAEAIESVLNQTYADVELVVVDDGSTDGSEEVIRPYLGGKGVKHLRHDRNRGIPSARNSGIRNSSGEYIAFLDQDDIWMPGKLEKQVAVLSKDRHREIGLVFTDIYYNYDGEYIREAYPHKIIPARINMLPRGEVFKSLFMRNYIPCITTLIPRRVFSEIGLLDENINGGTDDYDLFLRINGRYDIHYVDEPLAAKRVHEENYSYIPRLQDDQLYIIEKMVILFPELRALKAKKLSQVYESLGYYYCNVQEYHLAVKAYMKAVRERPVDINNSLKLLGAALGLYAGPRIQKGFFELGKRAKKGLEIFTFPGKEKT